jgi:DNA-binding transcriptional LysR family regulator
VLTDAGRVLLEHAERLLNLKDQALGAVDDVRHLRRGQLIIATNELTCLYLLPLLHEFRRKHPAVRLSIRRALASRIPADVRDYAADLGVITYQPVDSDLTSVVIYRDQLAFVVPRGHRFTRRREVTLRDLGDESFVAHHVSSPYRAKVLETFQKRRVALQMPIEMPTIDAIKKFVAAGHGVALLPGIAVEGEVARGELVRVVWRKSGTLSHAATAFLGVAEASAPKLRGPYAFVHD